MAGASPVLVVQMRESLFGDFATRSRIPFNLVSALGLEIDTPGREFVANLRPEKS